MIGNALLIVVTFLVGWVALWPGRRALGAWEYHLSALPVGLLGWTAPAAVAVLLARPMGTALTGVSLLAYCAAVAAGLWSVTRDEGESRPAPAPWTFAVAGAALAAVTATAVAARLTLFNYDSWSYYHVFGVGIAKAGDTSALFMGARSPLIPAVVAGGQLLHGDWIYAVFPVMAVNLVALLLRFAWTGGVRRLGAKAGGVLLAALGVVLVTLPSFLFHAVFVHSQMYSALYLLLAVGAVLAAGAPDAATDEGGTDAKARALLVVAGLAAAAFALARPDGLAYMFVPMLLVAALRLSRGWSRARLVSFFAPMIVVLAVNYFPAYVRLHFWTSVKLSGRAAFAILVVATVFPVVVEALASWDRTAWLRRGSNAVRLMLAADVAVVVLAAAARPSTFASSLRNMVTNLFSTGGYGLLWPFLFGAVAVTLASRAWRRGDTLCGLLLVIAQFFAIALVVHGLAHEGRLSPGDSFNRVAFHVVPLMLWYVAAAAGALWQRPAAPEADRRVVGS